MDYVYGYRGREIVPILQEKVKRLKLDLEELERKKGAIPVDSISYRESIGLEVDKELVQNTKFKIDAVSLDIKKCEVMIIEMNRNKWKKYKLSLDDIIWMRY